MKISAIVITALLGAASPFANAADGATKQKGLRGAQPSALPQDLDHGPIEFSSKDDMQERKLQSSTLAFSVQNKCDKDMWVYVWWENIFGEREGPWTKSLANSGSFWGYTDVVNPVIHIHGWVSDEEHWGTISPQRTSNYCVQSGDKYFCGMQLELSSTGQDTVRLELTCPNDEQLPMPPSVQTPAPTPAQTPTPAPAPAPTPGAGPISSENELANEWLSAHNSRREAFHTNNEFRNRTYVPLKWSQDVARSAQEYADLLIAESNRLGYCFKEHGFNGNYYGGENLNRRRADYHAPKSPESILWGWFEDEEDRVPYQNHRTQVVWAGTKYLGCAQSSTTFPTGEFTYCQVSVCRYVAPGNCADNMYNESNVYDFALRDNPGCTGPQCPAEGCF